MLNLSAGSDITTCPGHIYSWRFLCEDDNKDENCTRGVKLDEFPKADRRPWAHESIEKHDEGPPKCVGNIPLDPPFTDKMEPTPRTTTTIATTTIATTTIATTTMATTLAATAVPVLIVIIILLILAGVGYVNRKKIQRRFIQQPDDGVTIPLINININEKKMERLLGHCATNQSYKHFSPDPEDFYKEFYKNYR